MQQYDSTFFRAAFEGSSETCALVCFSSAAFPFIAFKVGGGGVVFFQS